MTQLQLPTLVRFGKTHEGAAWLGSGWHPPEAQGVWSLANRAYLYLAPPPGARALRLEMFMGVYLAPEHPELRVRLRVNGSTVADWLPSWPETKLDRVVELPPERLGAAPIELEFQMETPTSPRRAGAGEESRRLGIFLHSIGVSAP